MIGPTLVEDVNITINVVPEQGLFRPDTAITVAAEINTDDNLICSLTAFGEVEGFNTTPVPAVNRSSPISGIITNQSTFSLTCDTQPDETFDDGTTTITVTKVVEVIPTIEEI